MKGDLRIVCVLFCLFSWVVSISSAQSATNSSAKCPLDFGYVLRVPWSTSNCKVLNSTPQLSNGSDIPSSSKGQCCQNLLSLFGVATAQHLKETSLFRLPNLETSISCIQEFQSKLNALSLPSNLTSLCFVTRPNICASIQTIQDWNKKLGPSTVLDSGCRSDLEDLTACDGCVAAGFRVQQQLIAIDGNASHSTDCFYFTILYAAGIVNEFGPESTGAMSCIFSIDLKDDSSSTKRHLALIFGLAGAGMAVLCMSLVLGLYIWWNKRWRKNDDVEMEDTVSRRRMRPNTAVWQSSLVDLPLKNYYRYVIPSLDDFSSTDYTIYRPKAPFAKMPPSKTLTMNLDVPEPWLVEPVVAAHDLDNILLENLGETMTLQAVYELEALVLTESNLGTESLGKVFDQKSIISDTSVAFEFQQRGTY